MKLISIHCAAEMLVAECQCLGALDSTLVTCKFTAAKLDAPHFFPVCLRVLKHFYFFGKKCFTLGTFWETVQHSIPVHVVLVTSDPFRMIHKHWKSLIFHTFPREHFCICTKLN